MSAGCFDSWPRTLICGSGSSKTLGDKIKSMGKSKVIVITDEVMKDFPMVTDMVARFNSEGLTATLFGGIGPNPTDTQVMACVEQMKKDQPEVIVCIGGGSPIDAAKAANVVYTHGGEVEEYDIAIGGIMRITPKLLPFICIPTTAGTGSEVTNVGVITNTKKHLKYGVLSPLLVPDISVLDAELTISLPAKVTANTGVDVLTHAIESYVSCHGFTVSEGLAYKAIKMVAKYLNTAVHDGKNLEARENMLEASMMAGIAFNFNGLGLTHQMAHQLSAYFDLPHGLANAILLPHVMRFNLDAAPEKFAAVAEALGADINHMSVEEAAKKSIELVEKLCKEVGIPKYLDEVGVTKDKVAAMAQTALADPVGHGNPKQTTLAECEQVFLNAFKN